MIANHASSGMAVEQIELSVLLNHLKNNLPHYAIPLFVRIQQILKQQQPLNIRSIA